MKCDRLFPAIVFLLPLLLLLSASHHARLFAQTVRPASRKPFVLPLQCEAGECPLLNGAPQTAGMRSGFDSAKLTLTQLV